MTLTLPVMVGGMGMAADSIRWSMWKRQLQRQADSAALAGAFGLAQSRNVASTVTTELARNNFVTLTAVPTIENAPTAGPMAGNGRAVRVALTARKTLPFSQLLISDPVDIRAEATAAVVAQGDYCAISLETADRVGIAMNGNASVTLNCGMVTNAPAASAITAGGSSEVRATPVAAVGGLQPSNNYLSPTTLIPYTVPQPDPLADLPDLNVSGGTRASVNSNQTATLSPGTYRGMDLKGKVTLLPGIYYVNGSDFSVGASANVSGQGVVIILSSSTAAGSPGTIATVNINGGATIDLTAPTFGTYAGVLFYQDRRALNSNQTNKINGNSTSRLQGAVYFPAQEIEFTGTTGIDINCIQLVARRISFSGNSTVSNTCPGGSNAGSFAGTRVKLVA